MKAWGGLFAVLASAQITPPEKHFGFPLGSDRKIARWDAIVDYFALLEKQSGGRLKSKFSSSLFRPMSGL